MEKKKKRSQKNEIFFITSKWEELLTTPEKKNYIPRGCRIDLDGSKRLEIYLSLSI